MLDKDNNGPYVSALKRIYKLSFQENQINYSLEDQQRSRLPVSLKGLQDLTSEYFDENKTQNASEVFNLVLK